MDEIKNNSSIGMILKVTSEKHGTCMLGKKGRLQEV